MATKDTGPQDRSTRAGTSRESATRKKGWAPPSSLDAPTPPPGYKYRWIRHEAAGQDDRKNIIAKMREGYEPVNISDLPEDFLMNNFEEGKYTGIVRQGDVMLAKIPVENVEERNAYYAKETSRLQESIEMSLNQNQTRAMPISSEGSESKASTGKVSLDFQN